MYEFQTNNCPFCESSLSETENYIQVVYKKNRIIIEHNVLSCSICSIKGASEKVLKELEKQSFSIEIYGGSPSYYASTIIEKRSVLTYLIKQNKQKKNTFKYNYARRVRKAVRHQEENRIRRRISCVSSGTRAPKSIGRMDLAEKVTWVANENCNAGYDIQSFFEDGSYKYIEVKSTTARNVNFYLTNNELEVAKLLGDNYFIYRVSNLRSILKSIRFKIHMI